MKDGIIALLFGAVLLVGTLGLVEGTLRFLPEDVLPEKARKAPPLVETDQVNIVYRQNGFRGKRPCVGCPDDTVRIITMGGSSTMGIPMLFSGRTYSAELQRMLDERRPGERYEVLNGGIGGFGITQVYAALKEELLVHKPDIVAICSWFNDTAPSPGWYSIPGVSDWEAYQERERLKKIEEIPLVKLVRETKLYAVLRYALLAARKNVLGRSTTRADTRRPRMTSAEFGEMLERIAELGEEHGFLTVLITEPKNRTGDWEFESATNPYLQVMADFARRHDFPLVDTLTPLSKHRDEWLFYDFIHPNPAGHALSAEAIYDELFNPASGSRLEAFWRKRGVAIESPEAVKKVHLQFDTKVLENSELEVSASAPFLTQGRASLIMHGDGIPVRRIGTVTSTPKKFAVSFKQLPGSPPITDLFFEVIPDADTLPREPIGQTGASAPVPLVVKSGGKDYGWTVGINVGGARHDQDYRGYNVAVLGGKTGKVLHAAVFDVFGNAAENKRMLEFFEGLGRFVEEGYQPIVVLAVKTDGRHNAAPGLLSKAFKSIGGSGALPNAFESFVLIGANGAAPGTAVEQSGPRLIETSIGDPKRFGENLLRLSLKRPPSLLSVYSGGVDLVE